MLSTWGRKWKICEGCSPRVSREQSMHARSRPAQNNLLEQPALLGTWGQLVGAACNTNLSWTSMYDGQSNLHKASQTSASVFPWWLPRFWGCQGGILHRVLCMALHHLHCSAMAGVMGGDRGVHLEPGCELLQLRKGAVGPTIDIGRAQAGLVVGESQQRLVDRLRLQRLAPALASAPVAPLAGPVHLAPSLTP